MAGVAALRCLRCDSEFNAAAFGGDCGHCRGVAPSNLSVMYEDNQPDFRPRPKPTDRDNSLWRYGDILPVAKSEAVSLGEGGTPLHQLSSLGQHIGMPLLFGKDETRSPTASFKDRMACIAVSTAKKFGAPAVVSSSTGNAGAAVAAYAAKAGMPCVVFSSGAAGASLAQMRVAGATVVSLSSKDYRWPLMRDAVERLGWFPTSPFFGPVVGSNPYGIEGYKTLAYEIAEDLNWSIPDCCVLPVCYGDALIGMWRGFEEMMACGWIDRMPRMYAAEIYGSLAAALREGTDSLPDMPATHKTLAQSTTATRSTYQALHVLRRSGGDAISVSNSEILQYQAQLSRMEGFYVEPATAGAFAAIAGLLKKGSIRPSERVVVLMTASGIKDIHATIGSLDALPTFENDPDEVFSWLRDTTPAAF